MTGVAPGWYKDPADPTTQRYWDGEGWIGHALPADAEPPPGPPPLDEPSPAGPAPISPASATAEPSGGLGGGRGGGLAGGLGGGLSGGLGAPGAATQAGTGAQAGTGTQAGGPAPVGQPAAGPVPFPGPLPPGAAPADLPPGSPYQAYAYPVRLPPPRPHGYVLATPGARLVARLIDIFTLAVLNVLVNGWFIWQLFVEVSPSLPDWARYLTLQTREVPQDSSRAGYLRIVIILITAALWLAYEVPAVANTGQTFGKRVLGIKVVRVEAPGPIGFARSLRRWNTIGLPTLLWTCCGIGFVLQFVDAVYLLADRPLQQALHDKSARTVVVRATQDPPDAAGTPAGGAPPRPGGEDDTDNSGGTA